MINQVADTIAVHVTKTNKGFREQEDAFSQLSLSLSPIMGPTYAYLPFIMRMGIGSGLAFAMAGEQKSN